MTVRKILTVLAMVLLLPTSPHADIAAAPEVTVIWRSVLGSQLFNLYAPASLGNYFCLAGWRGWGDYPTDKIFYGPGLYESIDFPHAHANDPTLVALADGSWRMYFTYADFSAGNEAENAEIWTARSTDQGSTWREIQPLIGRHNGYNNAGGWEPAALRTAGGVCLWWHGTVPLLGMYRACFADDGIMQVTPTEPLTVPFQLLGPDAAWLPDGRLLMVGSPYGREGFFYLAALESYDGLTWTPLTGTTDGLLLSTPGDEIIITPRVTVRPSGNIQILFISRPELLSLGQTTVHEWKIELPR